MPRRSRNSRVKLLFAKFLASFLALSFFLYLAPLIWPNSPQLPKIPEARATTNGQTVYYLHQENSDTNATYNAAGMGVVEQSGTTANVDTAVTTNAEAAAPCEGNAVDNTIEDITINVDNDIASGQYLCAATFFSPPVGQTISVQTSDTNSLYANVWMALTGSGNTAKASTTVTWFQYDGTTYSGFATTTLANTGMNSTKQPYGGSSTPAKNITFAAGDRLVLKVLLRLGTRDNSGGADSAVISIDAAAYSYVKWSYTMLSPNRPDLTGSKDEDFTTAQAYTACTSSGVTYNVKWTCLLGSSANNDANMAAGGATTGLASSSDWLILNDYEDISDLNFGGSPTNVYFYETVDTNTDGDGNITTLVHAVMPSLGNSAHVGLVLWASNNDYIEVEVANDNTNKGVILNNNGTTSNSTAISTYSRIWLRWSKTGTSYQAQYSTDGTTFTNLGSAITHATTFTRTGLNVFYTFSSAGYISGAFEYFDYGLTSTITVSGTAYQNGGSTILSNCDGSTKNISLVVATSTPGNFFTSCSASDGTFSFQPSGTIAANTVMTLFIDGVSNVYGTTVLKYSGSGNATKANVRKNHLILRNDSSGSLTNANLAGFDSDGGTEDTGDTDIVFTSNSNNLSVESGITLLLNPGDTYDPGGTVTTTGAGADFIVSTSSLAYLDTSSNTIAGNISLPDTNGTGGILYIDANTTLSGGSLLASTTANVLYSTNLTPTLTISGTGLVTDGLGSKATSTFYNLTTSGSGTTTFGTDLILDNDLSVGSGTTLQNNGPNSLTVKGGDATGDGTISLIGGTFTLTGTGYLGGASNWTFASSTIGTGTTASTTASGTGSITATSTVTIGTGSYFNLNAKTLNLTGSGNPFELNGHFKPDASTLSFEGTTGNIFVKPTSTYNLVFNPSSGTPTYLLNASTTPFQINNNLTLSGAGTPTVNADTYDPTLDINGSFSVNKGTFVASGTNTLTIAGNWTLCSTCTFTHSSATVVFDTAVETALTGATTFHHFTSITAGKTLRFESGKVFTFNGTLTLTGTGAANNQIYLRSSIGGNQWLVHFNNAQSNTLTYVNFKDSGCDAGTSNATLDATNVNISNTGVCWVFPLTYSNQTSVELASGGGSAQGGGGSGGGSGGIEGGSGGGSAQGGGGSGGGGGAVEGAFVSHEPYPGSEDLALLILSIISSAILLLVLGGQRRRKH